MSDHAQNDLPMSDDQFVTIAKVVKPQGRHGEVSTALFTDFPERFEDRRKLYAWFSERKATERRELELEDFWPHKGGMILKFKGVDSIEDAEKLKGAELQIPRNERSQLEEGAIYVSDLEGCAIFNAGPNGPEEIGKVDEVIFGAGEAPLLISRRQSKEYMIPLVEAFIVKMDTAAKRIEMKLPEGLLELDAPLSSDEKVAQQRGSEGSPEKDTADSEEGE